MFEELKTKLLSWTPEQANSFHENVKRKGHDAWKIWETTPSGYYFYDASSAEYRDYNGTTWRLSFGNHTESLEIQASLAQLQETNNLVRIDKPTIIETHLIYGLPFTYTKIESPYGTRGVSAVQLLRAPDRLNVIKDLFQRFLIDVNDLTQSLDSLTEYTNDRYPLKLTIDEFKYDLNSNKFFFQGICLEKNRSDYINYLDLIVNRTNELLAVLGHNYDLSTDLKNLRESQCTTLLP